MLQPADPGKPAAAGQKKQMHQQPEIQGRKFCPDAEQCGNAKGAFEQLHPGQHCIRRVAQRLPYNGHTAGQQLSQTGG